MLSEKYSLVGISRREGSGYSRFSADLELSKRWQTGNGLMVRGTGNILTAAYLENKNTTRIKRDLRSNINVLFILESILI